MTAARGSNPIHHSLVMGHFGASVSKTVESKRTTIEFNRGHGGYPIVGIKPAGDSVRRDAPIGSHYMTVLQNLQTVLLDVVRDDRVFERRSAQQQKRSTSLEQGGGH